LTYLAVETEGSQGAAAHHVSHDETASGPQLVAGWRLEGGHVEAWADRLGMIPIFYWHDARRIVVADTIAEVVYRVPALQLNDAAMAVFIRLGFHVQEDTPFQGISVLPPGGRLSWQAGRLSLSRPPLPIPPPFTGSVEQAAARYADLFSRAIEVRAQAGIGRLTLSGGRDSRHILFELLRQGHRPPALVTLDRPAHTDLEIARMIAKRVGVPHIAVSPMRWSIEDELTKNRWNHYLTDENAWYIQIAEHLDGPVFDGLAGGIFPGSDAFRAGFHGDELTDHVRNDRLREAARLLLAPRGDRTGFLREPFRTRWNLERAADAVTEALRPHRHAANPLMSFLFWNRTRREVALIPLAIAARRVPVRLPYVDDALLPFLASLPHPTYAGTDFHDLVIQRSFPQFKDIPYAPRRKQRRTYRAAGRDVADALRFSRNAVVRPWVMGRSLLEGALTADTRGIDAWLYAVLPVVQASRELGVALKP
jgi:hypothetical protein